MVDTVALADGGRVDWWVADSSQPGADQIHVQKYDAAGRPIGSEYVANLYAEYQHGVWGLSDGGYVVGRVVVPMDGPTLGGQVFHADGTTAGQVYGGTDWHIASSPDGGFVVASHDAQHHSPTSLDSRVVLYDNNGAVVTTANVSSSAGPAVSVDADGVYHASWNDTAGNAHTIAIDPAHPPAFTPPPAPTGITMVDDVAPRTGESGAGGGTNDATPTFHIPVTETGWVALQFSYAGSFGFNAASNPTQWREITAADVARGYAEIAVTSPVADNNYEVAVRFEDHDGIVGPQAQIPLRVDTQTPTAPTITKAVDNAGAQQGDLASGATTDDTTPSVQVSLAGAGAQPLDSVLLFDNGRQINIASLDQAALQQGYVTFTTTASAGSHSYTAVINDFAGNRSATSAAFDLTVDSSANDGRVITSQQYGDTLAGGAGNDTLQAGQGPDQLTGGGGGDVFAFRDLPWNAGHVTDFAIGSDRLDLSALFAASGYTGSDPILDGYVSVRSDGAGGSNVFYDTDGRASGNTIQFKITTLDHIGGVGSWGQLSGSGSPTPPPPSKEVNISPDTVSHAEGQSGVTAYSFTLTRSGDISQGGTTSYRVIGSGEHAADSSDFQNGAMPAVTFAWSPGEASKVITVGVAGDAISESDETFSVVLSTPGAGNSNPIPVGAHGTATGVILNDDAASGGGGQVYTSPGPGSTVTGGAGNDTLIASQGADVLTGNGGADAFVYGHLPWSNGRITDFHIGEDRLDLSTMLHDAGYTGADPVADGYVRLTNDLGGTRTLVYLDADGAGSAHQWDGFFTILEGVYGAGGTPGGVSTLTWAQLTGGGSSEPPPPPPPSGDGQVFVSHQAGDTLTGTSGADTLQAGQGPDRLTGGGGADRFVFPDLPWSAGHITDFTPGADKLDLSGLFGGYAGHDPLADHWLEFRADSSGDTQVYVDHDGPNAGDWPFLITTLDGVSPGQIGPGDWIAG